MRLYGIADPERVGDRTPTFLLGFDRHRPAAVAAALGERGMFTWDGHFYAVGPLKRARAPARRRAAGRLPALQHRGRGRRPGGGPGGSRVSDDVERRAQRWRLGDLEAVCDSVEPWEHGMVMKARRYPSYYDYNVIWVEGDPGLGAEELIAVADARLGEYEHRRLDFALGRGRRTGPAGPRGGQLGDDAADLDAALGLAAAGPVARGRGGRLRRCARAADGMAPRGLPRRDDTGYFANAREVAMTREVQVIASREGDELVGFAQLVRVGRGRGDHPGLRAARHRGSGRGTAITRAAIEAAGDVDDLWIAADDEDRPKELYARLGFRPAWTSIEFLRAPGIAGWTGDE